MSDQKKRNDGSDKIWTIEDVNGNVKFAGSQMDVVKEVVKIVARDYERFMGEPPRKIREG